MLHYLSFRIHNARDQKEKERTYLHLKILNKTHVGRLKGLMISNRMKKQASKKATGE